jgi:hypothetical protein
MELTAETIETIQLVGLCLVLGGLAVAVWAGGEGASGGGCFVSIIGLFVLAGWALYSLFSG